MIDDSDGLLLSQHAALARYQFAEQLARTKLTLTYRVYDRELGRWMILKADLRPRNTIHSVRREADVLATVSHSALPRMYDAGILEDERAYITLEIIEGATITTLLAQSQLSLADTLLVARRLTTALHSLHEAGHLHRDVKPQNVMVPIRDGVPHYDASVLLDFGIAAPLEASGDALPSAGYGQIQGTLPYMAPEQFKGAPQTIESDVFSLGATLHEMLFSQRIRTLTDVATARPANGRGPRVFVGAGVLKCITQDVEVPNDPRYPSALLQCLRRMLRCSPTQRPHSMVEVQRLLDDATP